MRYEPTLASVQQHPVPDWFHDAKLGIFVHWGLYSVPGWAPIAGELSEVLESGDWHRWFANNPYAEWYLNSLRIDGSPTQRYHAATYGADFAYSDFAPMFEAEAEKWDPQEWAELFREAGARYTVLTTKHHDGFLLWPSRHPNPFIPGYQMQRDLVGEYAEAMRSQGLTVGLYYSGGLDWTFNDLVITDANTLSACVPQSAEYIAYANAHWRELIDRYQTAVLWNDIAYPAAANLDELFAEYYNRFPEGVINNRFRQSFEANDRHLRSGSHFDFETPEYTSFSEIRSKKWESCRGIGASFGYNRQEDGSNYLTLENLLHSFVDIVSKNGNLLLNVGPRADGSIPELQRERLLGMGKWLQVNGEAIYGTRPWRTAEGSLADGTPVRFTQKGESLFATTLGQPASTTILLKGVRVQPGTQVTVLGQDAPVRYQQRDGGVEIQLDAPLPDAVANSLRITPQPELL